jgi:hypothetical protein
MIDYNSQERGDLGVKLVNLYGTVVKSLSFRDLPIGTNGMSLDTSDVVEGIYHVQVQEGRKVTTTRIIVRR